MRLSLLFAFSALCFGQAQLADADRAFVQAAAKSDKTALGKMLDADFTWIDQTGKSRSRSEVLKSPPQLAIPYENTAERKEHIYGDLGDVQANLGRAHVLRVWAKRAGGWKIVVYQEVMSLATAPTNTPGAGKDCANPCKGVPYQPKTETGRQVITAYSKLETAAMAHNSPVFATLAADEFSAASSNSNRLFDKRGRLDEFDHAKMGGLAPTPLETARLIEFGDAVLMLSEHKPDSGKPLHVTRIWVKRAGNWQETISYQTAVQSVP